MSIAERLTLDDLLPPERAHICNGVGPKGYPLLRRALRVIFPASCRRFRDAADQHDLDYWQGGSPWLKFTADARFNLGCVEAAIQAGPGRKLLFLGAALVMFAGVVCGGWIAWHYGRRRTFYDLPGLDLPEPEDLENVP